MKASKKRELVVELEHVQTLRRRALTDKGFCTECGGQVDLLSLQDAARLFDANAADLMDFLRANRCHFHNSPDREVYICLAGFLTAMRLHTRNTGINLIGE